MALWYLALVAVIQGITEFLPISSSGHLILLPQLSGMADQGQVIDVAVHVGTLLAVCLYFWRDVRVALRGTLHLLRGDLQAPGAFLALCLATATGPVILFGLFLVATGLDDALRSVAVIGWTMLIFGIVLYWADHRFPQTRAAEEWTLRHAIAMGAWQALALIPGTSRSGITITAGRTLGYGREAAARLSMLMSIPTILASGLVVGAEVAVTADAQAAWDGLVAGGLAFAAALAALWGMFRLLRVVSYTPYVIYRVVLGVILLAIAYT